MLNNIYLQENSRISSDCVSFRNKPLSAAVMYSTKYLHRPMSECASEDTCGFVGDGQYLYSRTTSWFYDAKPYDNHTEDDSGFYITRILHSPCNGDPSIFEMSRSFSPDNSYRVPKSRFGYSVNGCNAQGEQELLLQFPYD
jgi:hypothetical protein